MRARLAMAGLALCPMVAGCGSATRMPADLSATIAPAPPQGAADPGSGKQPESEARSERRGSEDWRIHKPSLHGEVAAYTTHASGVPGTRVGLKVSTTEGGYEASAWRIGSHGRERPATGRNSRSDPSRRPDSVQARHAWIVSGVRRTSSPLARETGTSG